MEHFITAKTARENCGEKDYDRVDKFLYDLSAKIEKISLKGCHSLTTSAFWNDTDKLVILSEDETDIIAAFLVDKGYQVTVETIGANIRQFTICW